MLSTAMPFARKPDETGEQKANFRSTDRKIQLC
jgi:hypothetical protein